jgi:hypothetical protein
MRLLYLLKAAKKGIVLGVRDLRRVEDIIETVVPVDLIPERLRFFYDLVEDGHNLIKNPRSKIQNSGPKAFITEGTNPDTYFCWSVIFCHFQGY